MSVLETIAVLLGLANIVLIVLRSTWNYPFGLAMVALYARIFFDAKLYSDAALQLFFFVVQFYGWWNWRRSQETAGEVVVLRLEPDARLRWAAGSVLAILLWGWSMHRWTDASYPWWDAAIAMLSVAAQILMSRRYLENWHLWIAVNAISIPLYAAKGLWLTAGLYVLNLVIAGIGLRAWLRHARRAEAGA